MKTSLARKIQFRCAHLYNQPQMSEEENKNVFGPCFSPHGHGHTYTLEAYFTGPIDPITGMIINLTEVDSLLKETLQLVEDKHLNFEVEYFKSNIPTTENLAHFLVVHLKENINKKLSPHSQIHLERIRLYESEDLWVDLRLT